MHPLVGDLTVLKDAELELKINDLTKKYFSTNNFELQQQIASVLDSYKEEMGKRQAAAYSKMMSNTRNKDLDKLINVQ
jgi:hypothetical protein